MRLMLRESQQNFWRRWHISLNSWRRDYLDIPLGGNRIGDTRTCVNLMATMVLAACGMAPPEISCWGEDIRRVVGGRLDGFIHAVWIAAFFVSSWACTSALVFALSCPIRDQKLL